MDILQIAYVFFFSFIVVMFFSTVAGWLYRAMNKDIKTGEGTAHSSLVSYNSKKIHGPEMKEN
jgi:hypothetical protein